MKNFDKIVDLIIKELLSVDDSEDTEKNIVMRLLKHGYKIDQIDEAFEFIIKKIREHHDEDGEERTISRKIRILTDREKYKMTSEAHRLLLEHYYNDNLSSRDLEDILSQIEQNNHILDTEHLEELIHRILFKKSAHSSRFYYQQIN
ncbi:MAG: DUF494 family protein [bacterium]|nr:DUF494 family protein [bacterium]